MTQTINGVTAKITTGDVKYAERFKKFKSVEKAVDYMTSNDVIYGCYAIGTEMHTIELQKTDEANDNWYENEMRINNKYFPQPDLPTNMYR